MVYIAQNSGDFNNTDKKSIKQKNRSRARIMNRFKSDFKKYFAYAKFSARSDLKSEVASSYLNWLWWIIDPMLFMLVYTFFCPDCISK